MKKLFAILMCALLALMPLMALADGAPDALDMTQPLDGATYEFDFAPWYSSMDNALSAFGSETVWRKTLAGSLSSPKTGDMTVMECDYTSAITGKSARIQLIFETLEPYADAYEEALVGIRMIEELSDMDALNAYISETAARFDDMAARNALDMTAKQATSKFVSLSENFAADSEASGRFSISGVGSFTAPDGSARNVNMFVLLSARKNAAEYMVSDAPYCAIYELVLR